MIIHTNHIYMPTGKIVDLFDHMHGSVVIGERGQIVIPKKLRDDLKLKSGERLLVFEKQGFVILTSNKMMLRFINKMNKIVKK